MAFVYAASYFGSMVLFDHPPSVEYSAPFPSFFLALDHIPIENYKPIQKNLLLVDTAIFAEGVGDTEAAGKWAELGFGDRPSEAGLELLQPFVWLAIAPKVLAEEYKAVIQRARSISTIPVNASEDSLEALSLRPEDRSRVRAILSDPRRIEMSLQIGLVPLAFRLATVRFGRHVLREIEEISNYVDTLTGTGAAEWKEATNLMRTIMLNEMDWKELHGEVQEYYNKKRVALGILCFLGAILGAPDRQSLASQLALARDLEKLFETKPSIRYKIILPFFQRYWENAISSGGTTFRTSAKYTRRSYDEAISKGVHVRLKELFKSMVFCSGLSLPDDLHDWLNI
jgi:hypothetical protein